MTSDPSHKVDLAELLEFMFRLGQAHLACGEQTAKVELMLRRTAAAYGVRRSRVVAFPTVLFISLHDESGSRVDFVEGPTQNLRLDQVADVYNLGESAQRAKMPPKEGLERLNEILRKKARFGVVGVVLGNTVLAVGLTMLLAPTTPNLICTALMGAVVGVLKALDKNRAILAIPLPVIAAAVVSSMVFLAVERGWPVDPLNSLVPPLVSFLPGAMLTMGMVELAYGDMVSGASRLVTGLLQLVLLAFGLAAGAVIVGYEPQNLIESIDVEELSAVWAPWAGVIVFGIGAYLHFSAPRKSFPWMLLVLVLAFGAQHLATEFFGKTGSGFFGMLLVTPLGYLIQLRFGGPPAMVTFLPSFWLIVPGALGLQSVTKMLSDRAAGLDGFTNAVFVFASTALGTLVGASLYKWLTERFGWWQLQIGRVGRYFRGKPIQ